MTTAAPPVAKSSAGPVSALGDDVRVVYVPLAGGAVIGVVHAAPWLASSIGHAQDATSLGLDHWPGQPVFADEDTARAWIAWFAAAAPETDIDGWTVEPMLVAVSSPASGPAGGGEVTGGAVRRRVTPVTADGRRAFWRRPTSLLAESARAYLAALAAYLRDHVLPQLELARAALAGRDLDERTLRQLEGVRQLLAGAAAALADLAGAGRLRRTDDAEPTEVGARR
jgi:hypothetical protein